jgi:hypothetical protein
MGRLKRENESRDLLNVLDGRESLKGQAAGEVLDARAARSDDTEWCRLEGLRWNT